MDPLERRLGGELRGVGLEQLLLELAVCLHERCRGVGAARAACRRHYYSATPEPELSHTPRRPGRGREE